MLYLQLDILNTLYFLILILASLFFSFMFYYNSIIFINFIYQFFLLWQLSKDIYDENEDTSYSWVREYHWDVRANIFLKIPSAIIFIILLEGVFNVSTGTG